MFRTLRSKLIAVYLGIIIFGFGGLTIWAAVQMANAAYIDYGQGLHAQALQLSNQLVEPLDDSPEEIPAILATSAETINGQIALFDRAANLVLTTDGKSAELVQTDSYTYQPNSDGARTAYAAESILYEGKSLGTVQIGAPATFPQAIARQRIGTLVTGFVVISGAGLAVTLWLVSTMTAPLTSLRETALEMANGNLSERVARVGRDEIGEVSAAFNEMAERVEAMVKEQRAFASNASHELRTPITTIQLRTEALQDSLDDPELTATYVNEIDGEIKRMGRLVDDLLLLSRLDAKRLMAGTEEIDAVRVLRIMQRDYAAQADAKQITLHVHLPEREMPPLQAHLNHVRVVFGNVIGNAIKYTPAGGNVSVSLQPLAGGIRLQVVDDGVGISADDLPNIGKRFYRAEKAHSRTTLGTGLGLALVRSILALYNGELQIESAGVDQGTTVTIVWPPRE